ncbi:hypothetical protein [Brevibacillus reuszeri]|nr:hypothetical protein [Brevibacillus reuszeri]
MTPKERERLKSQINRLNRDYVIAKQEADYKECEKINDLILELEKEYYAH